MDALGPMGRHALLTVLLTPDSEQRADLIGKMWNHPQSRTFAELL